ncbi:MAG: hypothetical protein GXO74_10205 [Calditrichaeota bacterium]|nr:hypothetical protein [Calditrichota bacterium]
MKFRTSLLLTLLFLGAANLLIAGDLFQDHAVNSGVISPSKMTQLQIAYFNPFQDSQQDTTPLTREQQLARLPGYKLPKKALFFSALLPGAGELFVGSKMKAAAFLLVEVGAWTYYGVYHQKGAKKEGEFEIFADDHWDPLKWKNWYETEGQNLIELTGENKYTHAPAMLELIDAGKKTQQYYEMLGKYSEFVVGWEGMERNFSFNTYEEMQEVRDTLTVANKYMDMRDLSNNLYHTARRGITIAMVNRLLSAIDAAWTAKMHNNQLLKTTLRMEQIYFVDRMEPVLSLKFNW